MRTPQLKVGGELIIPALPHGVIAKISVCNVWGGFGSKNVVCNVVTFEGCGTKITIRSLELGN